MEKKYGLTPTEYEIMDYIWSEEDPKSFREILTYFNTVKNKEWKKQTLSTYLKILENRNLIKVDSPVRKKQYTSVCTKAEHVHNWTVQICESSFDNSIGKFILAYSGGKRLEEKSIDELKQYLKKYE